MARHQVAGVLDAYAPLDAGLKEIAYDSRHANYETHENAGHGG